MLLYIQRFDLSTQKYLKYVVEGMRHKIQSAGQRSRSTLYVPVVGLVQGITSERSKLCTSSSIWALSCENSIICYSRSCSCWFPPLASVRIPSTYSLYLTRLGLDTDSISVSSENSDDAFELQPELKHNIEKFWLNDASPITVISRTPQPRIPQS